MGEHELMLVEVAKVLNRVARPHLCDAPLPADVQASVWRLGLICDKQTPREDLVARLWARKRSLSVANLPTWDGPRTPPPSAA